VFGDKRQLFLEAVARYRSGPITSDSIIDEAANGREAAQALLLASSAISCSEAAADVKEELPADTHPEALASLTMAVIQGMSTLTRDGAPRAKLMRLATAAMQAWPMQLKSPKCYLFDSYSGRKDVDHRPI
jgi:hypothetical protein